MKYIFTFLCFLGLAYAPQDRLTNAYRAIQKGEYEKARGLLEKQQEKEPELAALPHVWAVYFFAPKNKDFSVDSAYLAVQEAIKRYPSANPKDLKEWEDDSLSLPTAKLLKDKIEIYAHQNAVKKTLAENDVYFMQQFIEKFPKAPQIPEAILLRNEIAWKIVEKEDKIEAYQTFLNNYPNTAFQTKAVERRDKLIFQRETQAGTMLAYQNFVKHYTGKNIFVNEAVEILYPLYTASFGADVFGNFWDEYKNFPTAKKAWAQLFYHYKSQQKIQEFEDLFAQDVYNKEFQTDAWQEAQKHTIFPYFEKEQYGYLNAAGKIVLEASLENILPKHLCQTQQTDYFQIQQNTHFGLRSVVGKAIFPAEYDAFLQLAPAVWRLNKNGFYGVSHESGQEILPLKYDAVEMLGTQLLKFKKNRRWGIATLQGQVIFEPTFTELDIKQNTLVVGRQASGFYAYKVKDFWKQIQEKTTLKAFEAENLVALDSTRLQFTKGNSIGIINTRLDMVLPAQPYPVRYITQTAFVLQKDSTALQAYSLNGVPFLKEDVFSKIEGNHGILLLKKGKHWGVFQTQNGQLRHNFELDSVALVDKVLFLYKAKKLSLDCIESTQKPIDAQNFKNIRVENGFIFFENAQQQKGLYDMKGQRVCAPAYQSIYPLSANLFNVQANGKYGLVDSVGKAVLPLKYDGIDAQANQQYALITNGKYGLFSPKNTLVTEVQYDYMPQIATLSPTTTVIFASKSGQKGVLDFQNKTLVPFHYKEVIAWQDSTVIVQNTKGEWLFYNFAKKGKEKLKEKEKEASHTSHTHFQEIKIWQIKEGYVLLQVKQHDLWGIWDNKIGEKLKPAFQTIENRGTVEKPFYVAEKKLSHHHYLLAYLNAEGKKIWEKELSEQDYERMICE